MSKRPSRIGIYSGAFDPVHGGHIGFALQALEIAALDEVCFVPERKPADNPGAEHFAHRVAMLRQALKPYQQFSLLELVDKTLSVGRTLPQLQAAFPESRLVLLMGADIFQGLADWPHVERLRTYCEFVVGVRSHAELTNTLQSMQLFALPSRTVTMIDASAPDARSSQIRRALRSQQETDGLLPSVKRYARREWLYTRIT